MNEPLVIRRRVGTNLTNDKFLFIKSGIRLFQELQEENIDDEEISKIIEEES